MQQLPIGDHTLSSREIIGNESQERMGLVVREQDVERVRKIAEREEAPFYVVGETTDDHRFVFEQEDGTRPIDLEMTDMFGKSPKTVMTDTTVDKEFDDADYNEQNIVRYLENVLQLEAVACKDWLTNKVDRSVTGRVARQQCQGPLQLPLSDCGVVALDYHGRSGIATSIGHAPQAALIDPAKGSVLAIAEALTNINGALLADGLKSVSLSANWMWPCKNPGEDAALYKAVKACSDFACALGINIPTGKDSLSMTQKYGERKVMAPGTVIISAAGEVSDIRKTVSPVMDIKTSQLWYIDMSRDSLKLGGSAFLQSLNKIGTDCPTVTDPAYFAKAFNVLQRLNREGLILAQHDVSAGGLITTLLEMNFANTHGGMNINLDCFEQDDAVKILFAENPAIVIQVSGTKASLIESIFAEEGIAVRKIGCFDNDRKISVTLGERVIKFDIDNLRNVWYKSSWLLDRDQTVAECSDERYRNYSKQPLKIKIPGTFDGKLSSWGLPMAPAGRKARAAIIREKGVNGDREMAYCLYLAGFEVKDVHMTDLMSGRENLEDVNMIVFCGGFSNSDVLGSAKGWAGGFRYNEKARAALENFYERADTLSLGVCNGCQLMMELNLVNPEHSRRTKMAHNDSHKFESGFVSVTIPENDSVMFKSLSGYKLGIWVAHGEGKFIMPESPSKYNVIARYNYNEYPANPNGSRRGVAGLVSANGRHVAMMPHLERSVFPWQCGHYPNTRLSDDITPWLTAFINARKWIEERVK